MVEVIVDNTKNIYYTKCKHCNSVLNYKYEDVEFAEVPYSFIPNRTIVCPACKSITSAELTTERQYDESKLPFMPNMATFNSCCCEKGDDL